jgi:hypothetical protein
VCRKELCLYLTASGSSLNCIDCTCRFANYIFKGFSVVSVEIFLNYASNFRIVINKFVLWYEIFKNFRNLQIYFTQWNHVYIHLSLYNCLFGHMTNLLTYSNSCLCKPINTMSPTILCFILISSVHGMNLV